MKTDARVRYTRKVIRDTFLDILREKPVAKITVKEICDKAEINRGTFYKHYRDCYDLMEQIEEDALHQFEETSDSIKTPDIHMLLLAILDTVRGNEQLIRIMADTAGSRSFICQLIECCFQHMNKWLKYYSKNNLPETNQIIGSVFLAGGCSNVIEYWLHSGMKASPEELANLLDILSKSVAEKLSEL